VAQGTPVAIGPVGVGPEETIVQRLRTLAGLVAPDL
jgi:hypothetical protein